MNNKKAVVAKLLCVSKEPTVGQETTDVDFNPIDAVFASKICLYGMSKDVANNFEVGKEYYLTILSTEVIGSETKKTETFKS